MGQIDTLFFSGGLASFGPDLADNFEGLRRKDPQRLEFRRYAGRAHGENSSNSQWQGGQGPRYSYPAAGSGAR
jgi:hypothetical protein